jgi:hypothetical protein
MIYLSYGLDWDKNQGSIDHISKPVILKSSFFDNISLLYISVFIDDPLLKSSVKHKLNLPLVRDPPSPIVLSSENMN